MCNTPEFWMYVLPISMVMISGATAICVTIFLSIYREIRYGIS